MAAHRFQAVRQLGGFTFQKFTSGRRAEKQLAHLDAGTHAARRRAQLAGACIQAVGVGGIAGAAGNRGIRHRGDGGQGFASETHGADAFQVFQRADLGGGMATQRQGQLFEWNAAAIVFHEDLADAAGHQLDGDLAGTGVQGVVHQFAHDRGRALDHLTGSDLTDQFVGQLADGAARTHLTGS